MGTLVRGASAFWMFFWMFLMIAGTSAFAMNPVTGFGSEWFENPKNNCYNFATQVMTEDFAEPGQGSGKRYEVAECDDRWGKLGVVHASRNDGLKLVARDVPCAPGEGRVALVTGFFDYHWYRWSESQGVWWSKQRDLDPTPLDFSRRPITDVETADRAVYRDFCGYFCVDRARLTIASPPIKVW